DLEPPAQSEHVGEDTGLDLGDVHGVLLLEDAGLHAVVTDPMTGSRTERVVDADERQRSERVAALLEEVRLGDLLVERAAGERDAERVLLEAARLLVQTLRARVLLALVAVEAVVDLRLHFARTHTRIGEREAVAAPKILGRALGDLGEVGARAPELHQVLV